VRTCRLANFLLRRKSSTHSTSPGSFIEDCKYHEQ
jgi:hypothetical protein